MRKTITIAASIACLGLGVPASASAATVPACTSPAVVHDGLVYLTCFPAVPVKQFPATKRCSHIDSWATETSTTTVDGRKYAITQKFRYDVLICKTAG